MTHKFGHNPRARRTTRASSRRIGNRAAARRAAASRGQRIRNLGAFSRGRPTGGDRAAARASVTHSERPSEVLARQSKQAAAFAARIQRQAFRGVATDFASLGRKKVSTTSASVFDKFRRP